MLKNKTIKNLPTHIGIIMDGNGRWATNQGLPRNMGHKEGINAVDRTIDALIKLKVKFVTFFAFSTENWKRSKDEIDGIFNLTREYLKTKKEKFINRGIKLTTIGELSKFPNDLQNELASMKENTKNNDKIIVNLALNYGGRNEIVRAVNNIITSGKQTVSEEEFATYLDTASIPDPDFIIRTSGEERVSNFMLYQMAYSEFYFPSVLWPDFNERHLRKALKVYSKRKRRFGGIK